MFDLALQAEGLPFAVALAVVALLALLQVIGLGDLLLGDADADLGGDLAVDAGLLSVLGLGRLPLLIWLMIVLSLFGIIGLAAQEFLAALTGAPWTPWLVAPATALVALPVTGKISRPLARLLPRDETTAIDLAALVGREAEIVIGVATPGNPARARVVDHHGQEHYVMLEPDNAGQRFVQGEKVLIVRREGQLFRAIARGDHYLPKLD